MDLTLIDKAFLLKKNPLFSSLDIDQLLTIADKLEKESYKKGTKVFQTGQDANRIYFIASGTLVLKNKNGSVLGEITTLDLFGDEGVLSEKPRAYDALCQTDVLLLSLSATHLQTILSECPSVSSSFLEAYASNLEFRKR